MRLSMYATSRLHIRSDTEIMQPYGCISSREYLMTPQPGVPIRFGRHLVKSYEAPAVVKPSRTNWHSNIPCQNFSIAVASCIDMRKRLVAVLACTVLGSGVTIASTKSTDAGMLARPYAQF